jgi:hypothetical protein
LGCAFFKSKFFCIIFQPLVANAPAAPRRWGATAETTQKVRGNRACTEFAALDRGGSPIWDHYWDQLRVQA